MQNISELTAILAIYLNWNKARLSCFSKMLVALFTVKTVNLQEIACALASDAQLESRYKRVTRFFRHFSIDFTAVAGFVFHLFSLSGTRCYFTMDRTNWQWGKSNINVLMLGIVYQGIAIPIYWEMLDKKGNSNTEERIALVTKLIQHFGKEQISGLLADREFIGKNWFKWLQAEGIPFYIRIKQNTITTTSKGVEVAVKNLFHNLLVGEQRALSGRRKVHGAQAYLSGLRLEDGSLLIVATSQSPEEAIRIYALRWEIETLFSCLKGRGFCFEATHITKPERIKKLLVLLAIAFCWALKVGEWQHKTVKPIRIKKHGRPEKSLFRYGLDLIRETLFKITNRISNRISSWRACLQQLIAPKDVEIYIRLIKN